VVELVCKLLIVCSAPLKVKVGVDVPLVVKPRRSPSLSEELGSVTVKLDAMK
jgi:hypothetical protein